MMRRHTTRRPTRTSPVNYISLAGEFFVLGELALRRLDASLTLGHTKEIDILVLNRATGRTFKIEVKTTERGVRGSGIFGPCYAWLMDESHGALRDADLVYAFVLLDRVQQRHRIFLVPATDVASYVRWEYKYWRSHSVRQTGKVSPMRMFRIPEGASS